MNDPIHCAHVNSPAKEPYHYTECGLDNVYLLSGYEVRETAHGIAVRVRNADDLHRVIGVHLARDKKVLSGKELRFLRNYLDLSQDELGQRIGVTGQTVARWEKGETSTNESAGLLIRLLVLESAQEPSRVEDLIKALEIDAQINERQLFELDEQWRPKLAA